MTKQFKLAAAAAVLVGLLLFYKQYSQRKAILNADKNYKEKLSTEKKALEEAYATNKDAITNINTAINVNIKRYNKQKTDTVLNYDDNIELSVELEKYIQERNDSIERTNNNTNEQNLYTTKNTLPIYIPTLKSDTLNLNAYINTFINKPENSYEINNKYNFSYIDYKTYNKNINATEMINNIAKTEYYVIIQQLKHIAPKIKANESFSSGLNKYHLYFYEYKTNKLLKEKTITATNGTSIRYYGSSNSRSTDTRIYLNRDLETQSDKALSNAIYGLTQL